MMAGTYKMTPGVVFGSTPSTTLLQARPQGDLTQLLTEVARQREEAAQLRVKVMQAPVSIPEKPGLPKQDAGMYRLQNGQSQVSGINVDPAEARSKTAVPQLSLRLPEALPQPAANGEPQPKSKNLPRTRRTSPEKGRTDTAPKEEMSTRSSVPRRSRPTSPNSPTRSSAGHPQGAPRLCISVPEHRLKPPEPQFLFSLPLRVTTGPKKLVDWSFKGKESRSGSPSRWESTLSESPRSFVWSALEGPTPSSVHRGAASHRSPPRSARQGVTSRAGSRNQGHTPVRSGATARPGVAPVGASGLSTVSTPAVAPPVLSPPNFTWNTATAVMGAASTTPAVPNASLLGQASARSVSPPVFVQPRSMSPPNVPQMRYLSPPPVMGR